MNGTLGLIKIWCTECQAYTWFILTTKHGLTCLECRLHDRLGELYFETLPAPGFSTGKVT